MEKSEFTTWGRGVAILAAHAAVGLALWALIIIGTIEVVGWIVEVLR